MVNKIIDLQNITVDFSTKSNEVIAVKDVTLSIQKGDIFGIVGYSGAGKSTLVRVINLLQRPTSGKVTVNGQDLLSLNNKDLRANRKKIGMIFQHFNLMNQLTVADNVGFALHDSKMPVKEQKAKVNELLTLVGLEDKADAYPRQLSGGQKQRVGIARALANDPDILISDEATSALDPKTTESILNILEDVNQKLGITIILITHQMEAIKQIAKNVAVMDYGKIIETGSVIDIFSNPKEELTKSFISTAMRLDSALDAIYGQEHVKNMKSSDQLVRLTYIGDSTDEPLISELNAKFGVKANILYGNIEILQGTSLGNLIVVLSGKATDVKKAITYLEKSKVVVEKLKPTKEES